MKKEAELAEELRQWFLKRSTQSGDTVRHSKVYAVLKLHLSQMGHWKNAQSGNPKLGFRLGCGKQQD